MASSTVYQLLSATDQVSSRLRSNNHILLEYIPIMDETQGMSSYELSYDKSNKMAIVPSEDSNQSGHLPSLIRAFAVHSMGR